MPDSHPSEPDGPNPWLGRILALVLAALMGMVALGVFWVSQRARKERAQRERIQSTEPFQAPPKTR